MVSEVVIERLAAHPQLLPTLQQWFEAEWPAWYGPDGPGDARADLQAFADPGGLPVGLVALHGGAPCGVAVLKAETLPARRHLGPWAAAGLVDPRLRGRGIGAQLLAALEREAAGRGYREIWCATNTAESLLRRCGWELVERLVHDGERLGVYRKPIRPPSPAAAGGDEAGFNRPE